MNDPSKSIRYALLILAMLLSALWVPSSYAGGSIEWERVQAQIQKDDPFMANYISSHLTVNGVGGATRVGHDKDGNSMVEGVEVGTRLPPYLFYAKPKGQDGDFTFYLTIEPVDSADGKTTLWQVTIRKKLPTDW